MYLIVITDTSSGKPDVYAVNSEQDLRRSIAITYGKTPEAEKGKLVETAIGHFDIVELDKVVGFAFEAPLNTGPVHF